MGFGEVEDCRACSARRGTRDGGGLEREGDGGERENNGEG